jgi:subtilisin family serine protease
VVAPSSGGVLDIFTTDVSLPGRGFNVGRAPDGGKDGRYTNAFGGTSSATPLAAGVGALVLCANPKLASADVREMLRTTADKIDAGYDAQGFSPRYGYGRVNAARAVNAAKARH